MKISAKSFTAGIPKKQNKSEMFGSAFYQMGVQKGKLDEQRKKAEEDAQLLQLQQVKVDVMTAGLKQNQMMIQNMLQAMQQQQLSFELNQMQPLPGVGAPGMGMPPLPDVGAPQGGLPPLPGVGAPGMGDPMMMQPPQGGGMPMM